MDSRYFFVKIKFLVIFVLFGFISMQSALACSPAPDSRPASIAEKVQSASYVFEGLVKSINSPEAIIQVEQYFKGNGLDEVKITGFNTHSCSDYLTVGQRAIFFAEGDINSTLSAVYDGAFGSIRQVSPETFVEIAAALNCMAIYQDGALKIPCVAVKDMEKIYSADLVWQKSSDPMAFSLKNAQVKKPSPIVAEKPKAHIENIEILILESFPVQVHVIAKGYFINGCEQLDQMDIDKSDNTFTVTMTTKFVGEVCTEALVPFEEVIPLKVNGLKAGIYTVDVNGITDTFELAIDNIIQNQ